MSADYQATPDDVFAPTAESIAAHLEPLGAEVIGHSREGRPLHAMTIGEGPFKISITAGAHADEPTGPLTLIALIKWLLSDAGSDLRTKTQWSICPHVNPDGAAHNAVWFSETPDLERYLDGAVREAPGDDVEFNYPDGRPENQAVAAFISEGGKQDLHFSLHGMGFSEGAWWLLGERHAEQTAPLRALLAEWFRSQGWGLFDWDRKGEKGFRGLGPGFSTTPTSVAMNEFFHDDPEMAAKFRLSSMEFVQSLGSDPLVVVSELPLFAVESDATPHPSGKTAFTRVREHFQRLRHSPRAERDPNTLLKGDFDLTPVPFVHQITTLFGAVMRTVHWSLR